MYIRGNINKLEKIKEYLLNIDLKSHRAQDDAYVNMKH